MDLKELLENVSSLHANIARDAYPDGGILYCLVCKRELPYTTQDAANYLAHGWPKCCGQGMRQRNTR